MNETKQYGIEQMINTSRAISYYRQLAESEGKAAARLYARYQNARAQHLYRRRRRRIQKKIAKAAKYTCRA